MNRERYVLECQLGAGGMGDVWLATDSLLDRPVAVKFLQATQNLRFRDLFLSEARTLASLQHPNITTIYDAVFDESENRFYIIMEYVEGKSVSAIIDETDTPLPLDTVVNVTIGVLKALCYAHDKGFVHRDIKPENIIIHNDQIKLTDFGLAGLISLLNEQDSGYIAGTPPYMSPEQISGETIDGRSDLYSLGVTLFEMLTGGRLPFEHELAPMIMTAHLEDDAPSVREFEATVPLQLEQIISRLLAKQPEKRFASAQELLDVFVGLQARKKFSQRYLQFFETDSRPLVGRGNELIQLSSIWQEIQQSKKSKLAIICGEPGVGRSRILAEFLGNTLIDQNIPALVGRCNELGAPYTPYAEILATIFEKGLVKPATIQNQIAYLTDQLPSLGPLLNVETPAATVRAASASSGGLWQTLSNRLPTNPSNDPVQAQQQFFTTVLNIFSQLGTCALYLNDADFVDDATLSLTRFLLRQTDVPLLILAEVHSSASDQPLAWTETFSDEEKETLFVEPLRPDEVRQYLEHLLEGPVTDAVVRIVEKRSRGIPQQIDDLTRHLTDMGDFYRNESGAWEYLPPPVTGDLSDSLLSYSLTTAFTRQLEKLSPENKSLLAIAALIETNSEFDLNIWLAVLDSDAERDTAHQALEQAMQRRIVRQIDAGRFTFRPAGIASALAALLPAKQRRALHKKIAEVLQRKSGSPTLIGHHFEQAGVPTQAAQYLESAGQRAASSNAVPQAVDYYKRAVSLVQSVTGQEALGNLYRKQGAWSKSVAAYQQALELTQQTSDVEQQARLLNGLALTQWLSDNYGDATKNASTVLKLSGAPQIERATAQLHLGIISWSLGNLVEAEDWCRTAVESLQAVGRQPRLAEAFYRLGLVYFTRGKFPKATEVMHRSLEMHRQAGNIQGEAYSLAGLGQIKVDQGKFDAAADYFLTARKLFEDIGSTAGLICVDTEEGRSLLLQQNYGDAIVLLRKALSMAQEIDKRSTYSLGDIHLLLAQTSLQLKDFDRAAASAKEALQLVEPAGNQKHIATGQAIVAQVYQAQGEPYLAEEMFKQSLGVFESIGYPAGLWRTQLQYARFLAQTDKPDVAAEMEQIARAQAASISLYV